jgi:hypothetical protein
MHLSKTIIKGQWHKDQRRFLLKNSTKYNIEDLGIILGKNYNQIRTKGRDIGVSLTILLPPTDTIVLDKLRNELINTIKANHNDV